MSELKAYIAPTPDGTGLAEYYIKLEVDKVIEDLEESHKKEVEQLLMETAELKAEIESLKASHYAEMVDAGMRERRLHRALYKACANWAACRACLLDYIGFILHARKWERMYHRCRAKAEEYK